MANIRLFSDDGIGSAQARCEPATLYYPDTATNDDIKHLFATLESIQNSRSTNGTLINVGDMPFSADLSVLIQDGSGNLLAIDDVSNFHFQRQIWRWIFNTCCINFITDNIWDVSNRNSFHCKSRAHSV